MKDAEGCEDKTKERDRDGRSYEEAKMVVGSGGEEGNGSELGRGLEVGARYQEWQGI